MAGYAQDKKASGITFLNLQAGMGSLAGGLASSKAWWKKDTPDVSAGSSGYAYGQVWRPQTVLPLFTLS